MALSFFDNKSVLPNENEIQSCIGELSSYWINVENEIGKYGQTKIEWKFYSKNAGWCKKIILEKDDRNILFAYPNTKALIFVMVFGKKAIEKFQNANITEQTKDVINSSKMYAEGISINFEVNSEATYFELLQLINIKVNN